MVTVSLMKRIHSKFTPPHQVSFPSAYTWPKGKFYCLERGEWLLLCQHACPLTFVLNHIILHMVFSQAAKSHPMINQKNHKQPFPVHNHQNSNLTQQFLILTHHSYIYMLECYFAKPGVSICTSDRTEQFLFLFLSGFNPSSAYYFVHLDFSCSS